MADLTIGQLLPELESLVVSALRRLDIIDDGAWRNAQKDLTTIGLFNLASVVLFTDHVAQLEGFTDSPAAMLRTRYVNLPWWIYSIWLPLEFDAPREPALPDHMFLGSSFALLSELAEVQKLSPLSLGTTPPGYVEMRSDYSAWFRSGSDLVGDQAIIQWIWKGLDEAARISIEETAPIFGWD